MGKDEPDYESISHFGLFPIPAANPTPVPENQIVFYEGYFRPYNGQYETLTAKLDAES